MLHETSKSTPHTDLRVNMSPRGLILTRGVTPGSDKGLYIDNVYIFRDLTPEEEKDVRSKMREAARMNGELGKVFDERRKALYRLCLQEQERLSQKRAPKRDSVQEKVNPALQQSEAEAQAAYERRREGEATAQRARVERERKEQEARMAEERRKAEEARRLEQELLEKERLEKEAREDAERQRQEEARRLEQKRLDKEHQEQEAREAEARKVEQEAQQLRDIETAREQVRTLQVQLKDALKAYNETAKEIQAIENQPQNKTTKDQLESKEKELTSFLVESQDLSERLVKVGDNEFIADPLKERFSTIQSRLEELEIEIETLRAKVENLIPDQLKKLSGSRIEAFTRLSDALESARKKLQDLESGR